MSAGHARLSGAANDRDELTERPLLEEVLASVHSECRAHGRVRSSDLTNDRRLDLALLLRNADQDNVTEHKPLNGNVHRHRPRLPSSSKRLSRHQRRPWPACCAARGILWQPRSRARRRCGSPLKDEAKRRCEDAVLLSASAMCLYAKRRRR
jgi:hypothetical protein